MYYVVHHNSETSNVKSIIGILILYYFNYFGKKFKKKSDTLKK
jgi:hypothetical protein